MEELILNTYVSKKTKQSSTDLLSRNRFVWHGGQPLRENTQNVRFQESNLQVGLVQHLFSVRKQHELLDCWLAFFVQPTVLLKDEKMNAEENSIAGMWIEV